MLLSTCNRVELYTATSDTEPRSSVESALAHLADFHNVPVDDVRGDVVTLENTEVVRHLFSVAASLDSMVVGEAQILGQVKQAYELAGTLGCTGPLMHHLFQSALRVARRVASDTSLHRHRVSIPSIAIADFATRIFERFDDKRVLVIGAGEMAQETLRYLTDAGSRQLVILNRDYNRALGIGRGVARHARRLDRAHRRAGPSRRRGEHHGCRSACRESWQTIRSASPAAGTNGRCSF